MKQKTLKSSCSFQGKGLHTGRIAEMTVNPASENTGIVFRRTDLGEEGSQGIGRERIQHGEEYYHI